MSEVDQKAEQLKQAGFQILSGPRKTGDGYYEFDDLFPGEYWVYIYGEDSTGQTPGGILPVVDTVQISGNNESILLPELVRVD